jgi:hypothetical protein
MRLPDDFKGLTEPGWPRPLYRLRRRGHISKPDVDIVIPVPWVTPVPRFAQTDPHRRIQSKARKLCQVCGFAHERGAEAVVFLNGGLRARPERLPDPERFKHVILRAIDDSVMHPHCARLAAGNCPRLREMRQVGDLWAFAGPIEAVDLYDDTEKPIAYSSEEQSQVNEGVERPAFETFLAMEGAHARVFEELTVVPAT